MIKKVLNACRMYRYFDVMVHYITLGLHLLLFSFALWMLLFSDKIGFSAVGMVLLAMTLLLILNGIAVVINHMMYRLNYDLLVKEYLHGAPTVALEHLKRERWREPPFLRSDGRRYMQLVHCFYKEWRMKSHLFYGVPYALKVLVILFYLLIIVELLCLLVLFSGLLLIVIK